MLKNRWIALVISLLLLGVTGCTGTLDVPTQNIPAGQEREQPRLQAEQPSKPTAGTSSEKSEPNAGTTDRRTESAPSPATDKLEVPVSQAATQEEEQTTQPTPASETSDLQIDREGIRFLLFQNLTSTPDRPPNQKAITDPVTIHKMMDCIEEKRAALGI